MHFLLHSVLGFMQIWSISAIFIHAVSVFVLLVVCFLFCWFWLAWKWATQTNNFLKSKKSSVSGNCGTKCLRKTRELKKYIVYIVLNLLFIMNDLSHDINNWPATESVNVVNELVLQTSPTIKWKPSIESQQPGGISLFRLLLGALTGNQKS